MDIKNEAISKRWLKAAKASPYWRLETALVVGSVVVGVASAALSDLNRDASTQALLDRYRTRFVYVAERDLPAGTIIDRTGFVQGEMLVSNMTANTVDSESLETAVGRRMTIELKQGDPLLLSAVEGVSTSTVASKIPPGKRLATLQIADRAAGNGWVKPNDHVDIIAAMEIPGRGKTTFTLMQDVTLVSVGKATVWEKGASSQGSEIGFYVSLDELEFLRFAQEKGEFSLALRNPNDVANKEANSRDLGRAGMDMRKFLDSTPVSQASGGGALPVKVNGREIKQEVKGE